MMSKQRTADYTFRFANFAFELAREEEHNPDRALYRSLFEQALALVRHSNHLLGMAEEVGTVNCDDPLELGDFEANWRQGLIWWNKASEAFVNSLNTHTQIRIFRHMEGFWAL